jgi:hypothetical protein
MKRFTDAVERALTTQNWYAALAMSLTLPDICSKLETPSAAGSQKRYSDWFDQYLAGRYQSRIGPRRELHTFLSGADCYALRCSYLHEGTGNTEGQRARQALDHFHFVAPRNGWTIHLNQRDSVLQLQVDIFCRDVCDAVLQWENEMVSKRRDVVDAKESLLVIHSLDGGFVF